MKLPRDLSGADLEKALRRAYGYEFVRQVGSHRRLTARGSVEHHLTIPSHDTLRPGTLRAILGEVMTTPSPHTGASSEKTRHGMIFSKVLKHS